MAPDRDLRASFDGTLRHLQFLESQDTSFESASPIGRPILNAFTSASKNRDRFHRDLAQAQQLATEAHTKLLNDSLTGRDLDALQAQVDSAQHDWTRYLQKHVFWGSQWDGLTSAVGWGAPSGLAVGGLATLASGPIFGILGGLSTFGFFGVNAYESRLGIKNATQKPDWMAMSDFAQDALEGWSQGKRETRYAPFFLITETQANPRFLEKRQDYLNRWFREASDAVKAIEPLRTSPEKAIRALVNTAYLSHLSDYSRDYPLMCGYYETREEGKPMGGDCEAETKYLVSLLLFANLDLPPHWKLGVQHFKHHVQAVIYDQKTGEVWDLLRGTKATEIRAPIYQPEIYFWAYLNHEGEETPVPRESLLIAEANASTIKEKKEMAPPHVMKSPYDFGEEDMADEYTAEGDPEFVTLPPPQAGDVDDSSGTGAQSIYPVGTGAQGSHPGIRILWRQTGRLHALEIGEVPIMSTPMQGVITFSKNEDVAFFKNSLKSDRERLDFLVLKAREDWKIVESSPGMGLSMDALRDPERIPSLSEADLRAMITAGLEINRISLMGRDMAQLGLSLPAENFVRKIHSDSEKAWTYDRAQEHFRRWVRESPEKIFAMADGMGRQLHGFLKWVAFSLHSNLFTPLRGNDYWTIHVLSKALRDSSKVTIAHGDNSPLLVRPLDMKEMEVELLAPREDPNGQFLVQLPLVPASPPPAPRPSSSAHISVATLIESISALELRSQLNGINLDDGEFYPNIARQWTVEHTQEMKALMASHFNATPYAPIFFRNLYPHLVARRSPSELTEPNPFKGNNAPAKVPKDIYEILIMIWGKPPAPSR